MSIAANVPGAQRMFVPTGQSHLIPQLLFSLLRTIGLTLATPFLLVMVLAALCAVLFDFTLFRLRTLFTGEPQPKGLWEF